MTDLFWLSREQLDRIKPYFPLYALLGVKASPSQTNAHTSKVFKLLNRVPPRLTES